MIGEIPPDHRGYEDGKKNQDAAHGRRPLFLKLWLRPIRLDDLSNLHLRQLPDDKRSKKKTDQEGCQAAVYRPECNISEDIQEREINMKWV